jgi:hypothetical protein
VKQKDIEEKNATTYGRFEKRGGESARVMLSIIFICLETGFNR